MKNTIIPATLYDRFESSYYNLLKRREAYLYPYCLRSRFLLFFSLFSFSIFYTYIFISFFFSSWIDILWSPIPSCRTSAERNDLQSWRDLFDCELLSSFLTPKVLCIQNYVLFRVSTLGKLLFKPSRRAHFMKSGFLSIAETEQCQGEKRKILKIL